MPMQKREQFIAELVARQKHLASLSAEERSKEEQENMQLNMKFQQIINMMDPVQKQAIMTKMAGLMPSAQLAFMKKLVDGGSDMIFPPSKEEL